MSRSCPARLGAVLGTVLALLALSACGLSLSEQAEARLPPGSHDIAVHSRALRGTGHYMVDLPQGYDRSRRRYPVVFLLHGLPAGPQAYRQDRVARFGRLAAARGRPAIIVSPQGARAGDRDPEWHDWGPGRDWETFVAREVVHSVDQRFRTFADRRTRVIIGVSSGGYGAMLIGLHHPDTFSVIQSWSGYFHPTNPKGDKPLDVGGAGENARADAHQFVACLGRLAVEDRPAFLGFFIGDRDPLFVAENLQFHRELTAAGVSHRFAIYRGAHTGSFWLAHDEGWLVRALRAMPPNPGRAERNPALHRLAAKRAGCPID
jgi:putative tributyrin esterase